MLKLSDISAEEVLYGSEDKFLELAKSNNCYSVEDLLSLMECYPQYKYDEVNKGIALLKSVIAKGNRSRLEPEIYEYQNNGIELVDELNKASVLLTSSYLYCG